MKEMGVGWALRKAAAAACYGCDRTFHTILQESGHIQVTTKNPKGTFEKKFLIDGTEQADIDPIDKSLIRVIPTWDGDVLNVRAYKPDGSLLPMTRRYLTNDEMVLEQTTPNGVVVKRFFRRVDS